MHAYQLLEPEDRASRRTIADALEVLRAAAGFEDGDLASLDVGPMRLPDGRIVGLVQMVRQTAEKSQVVSLTTGLTFKAISTGGTLREEFDIFRLHGAEVTPSGIAQLADGPRVRAVEIVPALLPRNPSELDWRIVHATIEALGAENRCYRRLTDGQARQRGRLRNPNKPRRFRWPPRDLRFLDCSTLSKLKTPSLKEVVYRIRQIDPLLKWISPQKIANALLRSAYGFPRRALAERTCRLPQFELDRIALFESWIVIVESSGYSKELTNAQAAGDEGC
jgi:hypothetical protein